MPGRRFVDRLTLRQPRRTTTDRVLPDREHTRRARLLSGTGVGDTIVDLAIANPKQRVYEIFDAPSGLGDRWSAVLGEIEFVILDVLPARNRRRVTRLILGTTDATGEVAIVEGDERLLWGDGVSLEFGDETHLRFGE